MNNQLRHVYFSRELIRELLVALPKPAVRGRRDIHHFWDLGAVVRALKPMRRAEHALHALKLQLRDVVEGVLGQVDDGSILAVFVLHPVTVLVS